ncbi:MAG: hypothetical protein GX640_15695 [Fibrobacter sp.]|nr:hypothetical protein [Fibrobacter sp.]
MAKNKKNKTEPVLRFRAIVIGIVFLLALIAGPMLAVWKQVYINNTSINLSKMNDTLRTLNKEVATLQFACERYSATERIETFAREVLNLEYPVSSQIVIVPVNGFTENRSQKNITREILAVFKKSLGKGNG